MDMEKTLHLKKADETFNEEIIWQRKLNYPPNSETVVSVKHNNMMRKSKRSQP